MTTTGPRVARTRSAVLEVAVSLLLEGGAQALTIEAVVRRSGVARSTIYRHWPRRTDLVAETFRRVIPPLPAPPPDGDLRARLRAVLGGLASHMSAEKYPAVVPALLDSAARDPELAGFREAFATAQSAPLVTVLQDATGLELPADLNVQTAVAALVGPLFFRRVVLNQPVDEHAAAEVIDHFLRGYTSSEQRGAK